MPAFKVWVAEQGKIISFCVDKAGFEERFMFGNANRREKKTTATELLSSWGLERGCC